MITSLNWMNTESAIYGSLYRDDLKSLVSEPVSS